MLDCQDEMFTYRYMTPVSHRATPRYNKEPTVVFLLFDWCLSNACLTLRPPATHEKCIHVLLTCHCEFSQFMRWWPSPEMREERALMPTSSSRCLASTASLPKFTWRASTTPPPRLFDTLDEGTFELNLVLFCLFPQHRKEVFSAFGIKRAHHAVLW